MLAKTPGAHNTGADLTFLITQQFLQKDTEKALMGAISSADGEHISTSQVRGIHAEAVRKQTIAGMERVKSSRMKEKAEKAEKTAKFTEARRYSTRKCNRNSEGKWSQKPDPIQKSMDLRKSYPAIQQELSVSEVAQMSQPFLLYCILSFIPNNFISPFIP